MHSSLQKKQRVAPSWSGVAPCASVSKSPRAKRVGESLAGSPKTSIAQKPDQVKLSCDILGDRRSLIEFMPSVEPRDEEHTRRVYT